MSMTREQHLKWAKERAIEYAKMGDNSGALASMTSDCNKHPELQGHEGNKLGMLLMMGGHIKTAEDMVKHIEGYN